MKNLVNRVQLIGHLGKDVEAVDTGSGSRLSKCTLATNSTYVNKNGEKIEHTDWHNLIAWGKTAERFISFCKKGSRVAVQGRISTRSYDAKDGVKKYITEIVVDEFMMIDKREKKAAVPF